MHTRTYRITLEVTMLQDTEALAKRWSTDRFTPAPEDVAVSDEEMNWLANMLQISITSGYDPNEHSFDPKDLCISFRIKRSAAERVGEE